MADAMKVEVNADGSATATVGTVSKNFADMNTAVEWATKLLYGLEGEEIG